MTEPPFAPRDEPNRLDVLALFVAPTAFLTVIFLYPGSEQLLEYKARNPTTLTVIGSNLAHRSFQHIINNLIGLWLIGGIGFIFACVSQRKRLYYYAFASYLTILPFFADSFIRSALADNPEILASLESVGFSQTVGALVGFLALIIGLFIHDNLDRYISELTVSTGIFLSGFTVIFVNFGGDKVAFTASVSAGVVVIGYVWWRSHKVLDVPVYQAESVRLVVAALFVFYASLLLLFPKGVGGGFFGHMAGYLWGYLLPASGIFANRLYRTVSEEREDFTIFV